MKSMDSRTFMLNAEIGKQRGVLQFLDIEEYITGKIDVEWNKSLLPYTIYWSAIYILVIYLMKHFMKNRSAFQLRGALIIWNLLLATFSICGAIRATTGLFTLIKEFGFTFSVCNISFARKNHPLTCWITIFAWSKVFEFGDTMFVVLRKQNLLFLHWYHHVATLIFTWYCAANEISTGYWFCSMNLFVHSFMYSYYAMRAMKISVPRYIAMCITIMQIVQMFMGYFVTVWATIMFFSGRNCEQNELSLLFGNMLYLSYLFLFIRLFYKLYLFQRNESDMKQKKTE